MKFSLESQSKGLISKLLIDTFSVASEFDCDFEEDTLCKWELMKGSDFDLEVSKADRQKVQWDPTADHSGKG